MSYIKNCKVCGQRISLREMQNRQWVAFDANTDNVHKHNRKGPKEKLNISNSSEDHIEDNASPLTPFINTALTCFIYIAFALFIIWLFSN